MSSGTCDPYVKPARAGAGMGLFSRGKPRPIEYKRDTSRRNGGFLTAEENDALWKSQSEVTAAAPCLPAGSVNACLTVWRLRHPCCCAVLDAVLFVACRAVRHAYCTVLDAVLRVACCAVLYAYCAVLMQCCL